MSRKRIFFAADERLLAVLAEPLRRCGLVVETFTLQSEIVPAARIDAPDAILLNARLPDGSALSVFQALENIGPPPTVVILTQSQIASRPALLQAGIADVLVSPIKPRALGARMAEVAGGVRRNEQRERVVLPVTVQFDGHSVQGTTVNVSREGIGVNLREPIKEGAAVSITLAGVESRFSIWGRVMHSRPDGQRTNVGLRLLGLTTQEENELLSLSRSAAAKAKSAQEAAGAAKPKPDATVVPLAPARRGRGTALAKPAAMRATPLEASLEAISEYAPEKTMLTEPSAPVVAASWMDEPVDPAAADDEKAADRPERWPAELPAWLPVADALRFGARLFDELSEEEHQALETNGAELPEELAHLSTLEREALRFIPSLSPLERRALQPDAAIEILMGEDDVPSEQVPEPELRPAIAAPVSVCAAHRFRGMAARAQGAALVEHLQQLDPAERAAFRVDAFALGLLLDDLSTWEVAAKRCLDEAHAAGEVELEVEIVALRSEIDDLAAALQALSDELSDPPPPEPSRAPQTPPTKSTAVAMAPLSEHLTPVPEGSSARAPARQPDPRVHLLRTG